MNADEENSLLALMTLAGRYSTRLGLNPEEVFLDFLTVSELVKEEELTEDDKRFQKEYLKAAFNGLIDRASQ